MRPSASSAEPDQDVAAEALDQAEPVAGPAASAGRRASGPAGSASSICVRSEQALLHLADADPDPGVHVAVAAQRHLEAQACRRAHSAGRGGCRNRGPRRGRHSRRRRSVRQGPGRAVRSTRSGRAARGCCRRDPTRTGKRARSSLDQPMQGRSPAASRSTLTPPGTIRSRMKRWPKRGLAARSTCSRSTLVWASIIAKAASLQIAPISPRWLASRSSSAMTPRSVKARSGTSTSSAASAAWAKAQA